MTYNLYDNVRSLCQSQVTDPTQDWIYNRPIGGANPDPNYFEPYRLGDFRNYDHNAVGPLEIEPLKLYLTHGDAQQVHFINKITSGSMKFSDVLIGGNTYKLGVYMVKEKDIYDIDKYVVMYSNKTIYDEMGDLSIAIGFNNTLMDSYEPMIMGAFYYAEMLPGIHYIPIENAYRPFAYERGNVADITLEVDQTQVSPYTTFFWTLSFFNFINSTEIFNIVVEARYADHNIGDPLEFWEKRFEYSPIEVDGSTTWTDAPKSFYDILIDQERSCYIGVQITRVSDNTIQEFKYVIR